MGGQYAYVLIVDRTHFLSHDYIALSWDYEPNLRPSATVILRKLTALQMTIDSRASTKTLSSAEISQRVSSRTHFVSKSEAIQLSGFLATAMRSCFDDDFESHKIDAAKIVANACYVTAADPVIATILEKERGVKCIEEVGHLLFGGTRRGTQLVPEPLLRNDFTFNEESSSVMLQLKSTIMTSALEKSGKDARIRTRRNSALVADSAFETLEEVLAREADPIASIGSICEQRYQKANAVAPLTAKTLPDKTLKSGDSRKAKVLGKLRPKTKTSSKPRWRKFKKKSKELKLEGKVVRV